MKLSLHKYAFALLASLVLVSCAKDYALVGTEREKGGAPIWLSTNVTVQNTRAAGTVSNDAISSTTDDWESKIVSLRMIISDSKTGIIVYNEKEDNPQELTDRFTQTSGEYATWRRPIKIILVPTIFGSLPMKASTGFRPQKAIVVGETTFQH